MKQIKKIILTIIFFIITLAYINTVEAASISASSNTVEKGTPVTITVSVPNVNTVDLTVTISGAGTSGTIRLVDGSMTGEPKTFSKSITVTPTSTGTISAVVSSSSNAVLNGQYVNVSASKSIIVTEPEPQTPSTGNNTSSGNTNTGSSSSGSSSGGSSTTRPSTNTNTSTATETKSDNSSLSVLQIAEGAITPEFNSGTLEYQINVPNETTKLTITATPADSKAIVKIAGNEELVVGENAIEVIVTAENGSTTVYKINAVRAEAVLNLQALNVFYINENGEKIPLTLSPIFEPTIYEYTLENITHQIENLIIEGTATRENAEIQITGNEGLKEGENTVQIKVIVKDESGLEEVKTYTIKLNKEAAPVETQISLWDRIKNWFGMAGTWIQTNIDKILLCSLIASTTALVGLTIYFIYDYKHYKKILDQLALMNKTNLMEKANVALVTENMKPEETEQYEEGKNNEIEETNNIEQITETEVEEKQKNKTARGKRFRE